MSVSARKADSRPLVAHVVFSFDCGGLENGVVNIINGLREDAFRHAVISLSGSAGMRNRIRNPEVEVHGLNKRQGKDPAAYGRLFHLLRRLRPSIVHTRNLGTIEGAVVARLAGIRRCIHGEHGWDVFDPQGESRKYRALRRLASPAIHRFVTLSQELERWLTSAVGIPARKVQRICNGVDVQRFRPRNDSERGVLAPAEFPSGSLVVGTVTRFSAIKDPLNLVDAFIAARRMRGGDRLRLVMIGDGVLRQSAQERLRDAGASAVSWLPGAREDIPELLRAFDVFALGSLREGISNTILEAMATGLPVIATRTGGNPELIENGVTGALVKPGAPGELAEAIARYATDADLRTTHGHAARQRVIREFSLERMLTDYTTLYSRCCAERQGNG